MTLNARVYIKQYRAENLLNGFHFSFSLDVSSPLRLVCNPSAHVCDKNEKICKYFIVLVYFAYIALGSVETFATHRSQITLIKKKKPLRVYDLPDMNCVVIEYIHTRG